MFTVWLLLGGTITTEMPSSHRRDRRSRDGEGVDRRAGRACRIGPAGRPRCNTWPWWSCHGVTRIEWSMPRYGVLVNAGV